MSNYRHYLEELVELTNEQKKQFDQYYRLLVDTNATMNLTTILKEEDVYIKHFYDSILALVKNMPHENLKVIDIGSGAGFPGIVLKIVFPNLQMTLLEATNKKCAFLNRVIDTLGLKDVYVVCDRAEKFVTKAREKYDIVIARAVANLNILVELALPFVKIGGFFIAMKGQNAIIELDEASHAIELLGGTPYSKNIYELPQNKGIRYIVQIKKIKKTPILYPRVYSKIKNKPL